MNILIRGKVMRGAQRGKQLGFPTINLRLHRKIAEGIYVSKTKLGGRIFESVSFVGAAKTFGETRVFVETYILDFDRDIYGKWVSVRFLKRIRGNEKFESKAALIRRIRKDVEEAISFFRDKK
jgi:riboflavin kinase/FMN adenylyltransferase